MALTPGVRLGPYEIVSALGAGGMGEVYKARDTRLDRTVAIKVLPEHVAADPELRQRFEREAKTTSSLGYPYHSHQLYGADSHHRPQPADFCAGRLAQDIPLTEVNRVPYALSPCIR